MKNHAINTLNIAFHQRITYVDGTWQLADVAKPHGFTLFPLAGSPNVDFLNTPILSAKAIKANSAKTGSLVESIRRRLISLIRT